MLGALSEGGSQEIKLPSDMVIFCDNTPRENKNTAVLTYMGLLQARHMFSSTGLLFPSKGHTHNILDQLFGIVSRAFQYTDQLQDLHSVRESIKEILNRPSLSRYFQGAEVDVSMVEGCRDWASWLDKLGVNFTGGLKESQRQCASGGMKASAKGQPCRLGATATQGFQESLDIEETWARKSH